MKERPDQQRYRLAAEQVAGRVAQAYAGLAEVQAIALAGSLTSGSADAGSDIDLYVYAREAVPMCARAAIATASATNAEVDNRFWESGDEWIDAATGIHVDVMFRSVQWVTDQLDRVLQRHEASVGYSTCIWHNVLTSRALYDRDGWFGALQQAARCPYPEALRTAILAKNYPILRRNISSYTAQLGKAVARSDRVSVNHRVAEFLASYFDILFALNRLPHPGEKRLVELALRDCAVLPRDMASQVRDLIGAISGPDQAIVALAEALVDGIDAVLLSQGLDPAGIGATQVAGCAEGPPLS